MTRGYQLEEIQKKLIDVLSDSKTGLSGVEISEKLGVNRATMAKYLNVFAAEGLIKQKNAGNINLWFIESGTEQLHFPDDYFHVKEKTPRAPHIWDAKPGVQPDSKLPALGGKHFKDNQRGDNSRNRLSR